MKKLGDGVLRPENFSSLYRLGPVHLRKNELKQMKDSLFLFLGGYYGDVEHTGKSKGAISARPKTFLFFVKEKEDIDMFDQLLKEKEVAELLKVSRRTLIRWRQLGQGPKWIDISGGRGKKPMIRYRMSDVLEFLRRNSMPRSA